MQIARISLVLAAGFLAACGSAQVATAPAPLSGSGSAGLPPAPFVEPAPVELGALLPPVPVIPAAPVALGEQAPVRLRNR